MKRQRRLRASRQNAVKKKIILGLTGSFGSGKSFVAGIFGSGGARVIDADKIAHRLIRPGTFAYKKIVAAFGKSILNPDRTVCRKSLGRRVFADKKLLRKLDRIVHPAVIRKIKQEIKSAKCRLIVLDAPLLIEAGLKAMVDKLAVVKINPAAQIKRLRKKTGLSREEILARVKAQIPQAVKYRMADFIIDNSGIKEKTRKQVMAIRRKLWRN